MWAGADVPVGSAQSSPRQLVRMGPCVSNMLRINNNIQKGKKRKHIHTYTHHTEWVMGLYGSIQVLLPYLAGAITLVNLSTQTINACQSLHVSSCNRAVGSERNPPPLFSFHMNIFRRRLEIVHPYQIQRTDSSHTCDWGQPARYPARSE
jgi:hypothetical protein